MSDYSRKRIRSDANLPQHVAETAASNNAVLSPDRSPPNNRVDEIDALLSSRPPILESQTLRYAGASAMRVTTVNGPEPMGLGMGPMTAEEENRILADVYGRRAPPDSRLEEERLAALEREISLIPSEERSALDRALQCHPLVMAASLHVKMLLRSDDFRPAEAAKRLARYWSHREAMFGPRAFSLGALMDPTFDDYIRHYDRCLRAMDDPELDDGMRDLAREYIQCIHQVKIQALDKVIESAKEEDKAHLLEAQKVVPEVAASDDHKILFLKCEDFIEAKAAVRMMRYWKAKSRLFGPERLHKDITLADVQSSVFDCGAEGHLVLMPGTDVSGRGIIWKLPKELEMEGWTAEGVAQYVWCIMHMALARPCCRANGLVVMIDYRSGTRDALDRISSVRHLCRTIMLECIPIRVRAGHIFLNPSGWWKSLLLGLFSKVSTLVAKRTVFHLGTPEENQRVLEDKFGIGPDQMLRDMGGDVDLDWWRGWIRERREQGF